MNRFFTFHALNVDINEFGLQYNATHKIRCHFRLQLNITMLPFVLTLSRLGSALPHASQIRNFDAVGRIDGDYLVVLNEVNINVDNVRYVDDFISK